jgi:hypothetical protein
LGTSTANVLCIDGHVRVYHGQHTQLPKHYVAREKLCLRATVDYWVNALDGQPFMVINQVVDPGLIRSIEEEILPCLQVRHPALVSAEATKTTDSAQHDQEPQWRFVGVLVKHDAAGGVIPREELD